ncbi:hypothetical protein [Paenibacillus tengchongensis]|uniref:hypothetical protein n=1 Tax=Paenibacillus tengchongensis TaxID=2608684 RepID=UPI00124DF4FA|nr:hypothetical protein [Paenibacillus tengchongensis]
MSTAERTFINEGILRIAIFFMLASLTYTVRNYIWAIAVLAVFAVYALVTGVIMMKKHKKQSGQSL